MDSIRWTMVDPTKNWNIYGVVEGVQTSLDTDIRPFPFHLYKGDTVKPLCFQGDELSILSK